MMRFEQLSYTELRTGLPSFRDPEVYNDGDDDGDSEEETPPPEDPPPWSRSQILILLALCVVNVTAAMYYSLLAPFFTNEVRR